MCGIVGCIGHPQAAEQVTKGLYALQHRGQEAKGVVARDGNSFHVQRRAGLVGEHRDLLSSLLGRIAGGHVRYSTQGASVARNMQPVRFSSIEGYWFLASNGDMPLYQDLRSKREAQGWSFDTECDAELILREIVFRYEGCRGDKDERVVRAMELFRREVQASYSTFLITPWGSVFIFQDPWQIRPLAIGRKGNAWYIASETCAFDLLGVEYSRDLKPGEMLRFVCKDKEVEVDSYNLFALKPAHCIFEFAYFSRPDSKIWHQEVDPVRSSFGQLLAQNYPAKADVIIPTPDSSNTQALGFAQRSNTPFGFGLIRNHYVGRTFIMPNQVERDVSVGIKFNVVRSVLAKKRVVLVEDSIVRGTTLRRLVGMIKKVGGATEVHVRVAFAPIRGICPLGMDFGNPAELAARGKTSIESIGTRIQADTLAYLSLEELLSCVPQSTGYCTGCLGGNYPNGMQIPLIKQKSTH